MGPPIFIGGNRRARPRGGVLVDASMGPPIFIGGNYATLLLKAGVSTALQWGHRFSSVEIKVLGQWPREAEDASMGPPIFIGGNDIGIRADCPFSGRFNGATDFHRWK